jgi:hypothetical protein
VCGVIWVIRIIVWGVIRILELLQLLGLSRLLCGELLGLLGLVESLGLLFACEVIRAIRVIACVIFWGC